MTETAIHPALVAVSQAAPTEVPVGSDVVVRFSVACPSQCDLRGQSVTIAAPDGSVTSAVLATFVNGVNETADVTIAAPREAGTHTWNVVFPSAGVHGSVHARTSVLLSLLTRAHAASLAVWDVPSAVAIDSLFEVKVGVKCAVGCRLTDRRVDVFDAAGTKAGEGWLGDAALPGTASLHWASVQLRAPSVEGVCAWTAVLGASDAGLTHEAMAAGFSGLVSRPPEYTVIVEVTAGDSDLPLSDAEVQVGPYQTLTDERGVATIAVPAGTYGLGIRSEGYAARPLTVDVDEDLAVAVSALVVPTKAVTEQPVGPLHPYRD